MGPTLRTFVFASGLAALAGSALAGTVQVSFIDPAHFSDAGLNRSDEQDNMRSLRHYIETFAERLPGNQLLKVDVLDVDLAGTPEPGRRGNMRVLRGDSDFPRIHLRYTLEENGRVLRQGDEWVKDMDYGRGVGLRGNTVPLHHEKRMLDDWFKSHFGAQQAASR